MDAAVVDADPVAGVIARVEACAPEFLLQEAAISKRSSIEQHFGSFAYPPFRDEGEDYIGDDCEAR